MVRVVDGVPLTVGDVATVTLGAEPKRGIASYNAEPAVILSVQKQPGANTLELMEKVDAVLTDLEGTLPDGVVIERENFRQSDFIRTAIHNITVALRDGAFLVILILFLFLGNWRTTVISALAIPLSLLSGVLVISALGGTMNTMTLGGFTIAIGALVDDAIIVVENVFRRLREAPSPDDRSALAVVDEAASSVLGAIFFATLIIVMVFVPLFFLPGMEGRLLRPLGFAYLVSLAASLLVSVTITPVLSYLLLRGSARTTTSEPWLMRGLGRSYHAALGAALRRPGVVIAISVGLVVVAVALIPFLGRSFLPPFNEGSLTVSVVSPPGITTSGGTRATKCRSQRRGGAAAVPRGDRVHQPPHRTRRESRTSTCRGSTPRRWRSSCARARTRRSCCRPGPARRAVATSIAGAPIVSFGQPIPSHRIDHMISGSKAACSSSETWPRCASIWGPA